MHDSRGHDVQSARGLDLSIDVLRGQIRDSFAEIARRAQAKAAEKIEVVRDRHTDALAVLALDDLRFGSTVGGLQLRRNTDPGVRDEDAVREFARLSARNGSWKCWLSAVPLSGGKVVVVVPPELLTTRREELTGLFKRLGESFQAAPFYARPDMNMTPDLMTAYAEGGGRVARPGLVTPAKLTAASVVGGLERALEIKKGRRFPDASVALDGAAGRIGREILSQLLELQAREVLVSNRDLPRELIAALSQESRVRVVSPEEALAADVDIYCSGGPPGCIGEKQARRMQAEIIGGPANDLLRGPALYRIREDFSFIPGAVLTAASVVDPNSCSVASTDQIRVLAARILDEVVAYLRVGGEAFTTYQAMVIAAELMRREDLEPKLRERRLAAELPDDEAVLPPVPPPGSDGPPAASGPDGGVPV